MKVMMLGMIKCRSVAQQRHDEAAESISEPSNGFLKATGRFPGWGKGVASKLRCHAFGVRMQGFWLHCALAEGLIIPDDIAGVAS